MITYLEFVAFDTDQWADRQNMASSTMLSDPFLYMFSLSRSEVMLNCLEIVAS